MALLLLLVTRQAVTEAHAHAAKPDELNRNYHASKSQSLLP